MTKDRFLFPTEDRAAPGEVMTLGLIAGVLLAALAATVTAMLIVSKMPEAIWTVFTVGVVFGAACVVFGAACVTGAALVARKRA